MRIGKKAPDSAGDEHAKLEQKVDEMMDIRQPDAVVPPAVPKPLDTEPIKPIEEDTPPEIDIFKDTKTAPLLGVDEVLPEATPTESTESFASIEKSTSGEKIIMPLSDDTISKDRGTGGSIQAKGVAPKKAIPVSADKSDGPKSIKVKRGWRERLRHILVVWWRNPIARWATIVGVIVLLLAAILWPTSRYFLLNTAGVRSSASLKIIDEKTKLPLKNVQVMLGAHKAKTNTEGVASFRQVRLGKQDLRIEKVAFAPIERSIILGWGSNPLGDVGLRATGARYVFHVKDYLANAPVTGVEAVSGEASAIADKNGKITLTVAQPKSDTITAKIEAREYRTETLRFAADTKEAFTVRLVSAQPIAYVTKQRGVHDVYKVDVDGQNKDLLLANIANSRDGQAIQLRASNDGKVLAISSKRDNQRDADGYPLDSLTLVDIASKDAAVIDKAQQLRLLGWHGDKLVYVATYAAPSAAMAERQRIVAYDTDKDARAVLATADSFSGTILVGDTVYYTVNTTDPAHPGGFSKIKTDGTAKQTLFAKETWSLVRTGPATFGVESPEGNQVYNIETGQLRRDNDTFTGRDYVAAGINRYIWVDNRDGKGVLLLHDTKTERGDKDKLLVAASGLMSPLRWLGANTVAYTINTSDESALYVQSALGGDPVKVTDATYTHF